MEGLLLALYSILGNVEDITHLFPEPDIEDEKERKRVEFWGGNFITRYLIDFLCANLDLITFLLTQVGWRLLWRGLKRRLIGQEPDLGVTVFRVPAYAERYHGIEPNRYWKNLGIASWPAGMDAKAMYYAVGSRQARWAYDSMARLMAGNPPKAWAERKQPQNKNALQTLLEWLT